MWHLELRTTQAEAEEAAGARSEEATLLVFMGWLEAGTARTAK